MNIEWLNNIKWFFPKTIAAVNIFAVRENYYSAEIVLLALKRKQINIISKEKFEGTIEQVCNFIPDKMQVCLSIDGKGILYKDWDDEIVSKKQLFKELLPQGNYNDFYIQVNSSEEGSIITIARQNYVNAILQEFNQKGKAVVDLIFGPFVLNKVRHLIKEKKNLWNLSKRIVTWGSSQLITKVSLYTGNLEYKYSFGDEEVSSHYIVPFSHAFSALVSPHLLNKDIDTVNEVRNKQYYKKAISFIGSGILGFYLILLLINYFLFTSLSTELNHTLASYEGSLKVLNKLEVKVADLQQKESLAKRIGAGDKEQLSFYIDRIASTIPNYITLTQFAINPLNKRRSKKDTPEFKRGIIIISGNISSGIRLYKWIDKLSKITWVNKVEVLSINHEEVSKPANFTIELEFLKTKEKE